MTQSLPSWEEFYDYAAKFTKRALKLWARTQSEAHLEEMFQEAMICAWKAFNKLNPEKKWKPYARKRCKGALKDYFKGGNGYFEDKKTENPESFDLRQRMTIVNEDGDQLGTEEVAGIFGQFHDPESQKEVFNPKWELISKMVAHEQHGEDLHIVAKVLLGYSQEEIAAQIASGPFFAGDPGTTRSRERISQRVAAFFERLDSPLNVNDAWTNQCIFALGLCDYYHMPEEDMGIGHDWASFNLNDALSFKNVRRYYTPNLFDHATDSSPSLH